MKSLPQYPTWIEALFRSGTGLNCFDPPYALYRQGLATKQVELAIRDERDGAAQLRDACLAALESEDLPRVERALFYLMVVGEPTDVVQVGRFLNHPHETIRKAARTCQFELKKKRL